MLRVSKRNSTTAIVLVGKKMEGFNGGGGEVRRVHILYVLSRNGAIEQPHLIRVHHLHRNGVYLRDVKRWLADLRGKDMPESFSWSYKRRYKSGYVWQDLVDDELITPISDNEYVLKGSEISSKTDIPSDIFSSDEEQNHAPASKTSPRPQHVEMDNNISSDPTQESSEALPPPPPPSLSSPDASDDSTKSASAINIDLWKKHPEQEEKDNKVKEECIPCKESSKNESHGKNKPHSKRTMWLFRNLFRCEGVETKDKPLRNVQKQERYHTLGEGYLTRTTLNDTFRN